MKRVFIFLLVILVYFTFAAKSVFGAEVGSNILFEDKFTMLLDGEESQYLYYDEMFYHKTQNDDIDWVLICAVDEVEPGMSHAVFNDIVILDAPTCCPFNMGLAVYDVTKDAFFGIDEAWDMEFNDLHQVFFDVMSDKEVSYEFGKIRILGDVDNDGELTIIDATHIQRCLASIESPEDVLDVEYSTLVYGFDIKAIPHKDVAIKAEI